MGYSSLFGDMFVLGLAVVFMTLYAIKRHETKNLARSLTEAGFRMRLLQDRLEDATSAYHSQLSTLIQSGSSPFLPVASLTEQLSTIAFQVYFDVYEAMTFDSIESYARVMDSRGIRMALIPQSDPSPDIVMVRAVTGWIKIPHQNAGVYVSLDRDGFFSVMALGKSDRRSAPPNAEVLLSYTPHHTRRRIEIKA